MTFPLVHVLFFVIVIHMPPHWTFHVLLQIYEVIFEFILVHMLKCSNRGINQHIHGSKIINFFKVLIRVRFSIYTYFLLRVQLFEGSPRIRSTMYKHLENTYSHWKDSKLAGGTFYITVRQISSIPYCVKPSVNSLSFFLRTFLKRSIRCNASLKSIIEPQVYKFYTDSPSTNWCILRHDLQAAMGSYMKKDILAAYCTS